MRLNTFHKHIDPGIRLRGESYLEDGRVRNLIEHGNGEWTATVQGTHAYRVAATLSSDRIVSSSCSCPYDLGDVCKHKVAVWMMLRDRRGSRETESAPPAPPLRAVIDAMPLEALRDIVQTYAKKSDAFAAVVRGHAAQRGGGSDRHTLQIIVQSAIDAARGRDGFIGYWDADSAVDGAEDLLEHAELQLGEDRIADAVVRCQVVIEELVPLLQEADDSNGTIGGVIESAFELLMRAAERTKDTDVRADFFGWCLTEAPHKRFDGWSDWQWAMMNVAARLLETDEHEQQWNQVVDTLLEQSDHKEYGNEYDHERATELRYAIAQRRRGARAAQEFVIANVTYPSMRRLALDDAWKTKELDRVKTLAEGGIQQDRTLPGLVVEWKKWLLKVAERQKNIPEIRAIARELFLQGNDGFDYYEKLKKTYPPEEWPSIVDELMIALRRGSNMWVGEGSMLGEICVREQRWDALLTHVLTSPSRWPLQRYEPHLVSRFPDAVFEHYVQVCRKELEPVSSRTQYRDTCALLKRMRKMHRTQTPTVDDLLLEFRTAYQRRRALMEELHRV